MNIKLLVGQRIKEIRVEKNMSQEEVANTAEMERSFITHIENGRRNISIDTLLRVVDALDISFYEFFNTKDFKK